MVKEVRKLKNISLSLYLIELFRLETDLTTSLKSFSSPLEEFETFLFAEGFLKELLLSLLEICEFT
jgi:hypothetical protein